MHCIFGFTYLEISKCLADIGIEKWTFDTSQMTFNLTRTGILCWMEKQGDGKKMNCAIDLY
ncbi:MAG: hypothetical protein ABJC12_01060 [Saprospiraceae bacterium]